MAGKSNKTNNTNKTKKLEVIVYSTDTCPYCTLAKNFLKENGISFKEINVAKDQAKAKEMMAKSGQIGVPQIEINGEMVVGFDEERLKELLGL